MKFEINDDFIIPDNLCVAAMSNGITIECDVSVNNPSIQLPALDAYPNIPIYVTIVQFDDNELGKAGVGWPDFDTSLFEATANIDTPTIVVMSTGTRYINY